MTVRIAPSILSADMARLGEQVRQLETAGADMIHVDIMDGHFTPTLSFGVEVVKVVREHSRLPSDAHLMVTNPLGMIDQAAEAGAAMITVHAETCTHLHRVIEQIRKTGRMAGVALNPATPLSAIEWVLPYLDSVTLMTVNPGYSGQNYIGGMTEKIRTLSRMAAATGHEIDLIVDGGINERTAPEIIDAGATVLVAGSYVFGAKDMRAAIESLRGCASA